MGTAMIHLRNIRDKIAKSTRAEPHELIVRLRASLGNADRLRDTVNQNAQRLRGAGLAAHGRTVRNSDNSLDAEIRIQAYDREEIEDSDDPSDIESVAGDFGRALLTFGDETDWPNEV